jgi:hypothetical protein
MTLHSIPAPSAPASGTAMLGTKAVLAKPSISQWTARKFDGKATAEVEMNHGAGSGEVGRFNKILLRGESLQKIGRVATAARELHYGMTLPWADDGARILPTAVYLEYSNRMRSFRLDFETAVSEFLADYDRLISEARQRLNGLFRAEDYPTQSEIRRRFAFDVQILPVPSGADFRVDVGDAVREDIERRVQEATAAAVRDAAERVRDVVARMVEKLTAYKPADGAGGKAEGIFRDSLVENVRDLARMLPAFNLTGDPAFARIADRVERELGKHDADRLREDPEIRKEVAASAESILADVADFFA